MPNSPPIAPTAKPPSPSLAVRSIELTRPLHWLTLAWRDMRRCGWISYMHGLAMALAGVVMLTVGRSHFWFMAGAFSGFLLVAPILATSLYALSRGLERGEKASVAVVLKTWLNWHHQQFNKWGDAHWSLAQFGVLLALAGTAWVLFSAALITLLAPAPITTPMLFIEHVVLARNGFLFELWLALGGILVAPIFASTVITIPLLLDRQVSIREAVAASWQVILVNPVPMAFWGAIIMGLTLLGFSLALLGLVLVVPLLGHASWHAYRELVDADGLPRREQH